MTLNRSYPAIAVAAATFISSQATACDLGTVVTKDKAVALSVRQSSGDCPADAPSKPAFFFAGDPVALEVRITTKSDSKIKPMIEAVRILRAGGQKAGGEPRVRPLSEGVFFADNIEFPQPGSWQVVFTVRRGTSTEDVKVLAPVTVDPKKKEQASATNAPLPPFSFSSSDGRTIGLDDLRGKVWVADFFFTSCPDVCPLLTQRMAALQRDFAAQSDFRLVSITTDPGTDTPKALGEYAQRFNADTKRWYFLTGDKKKIVDLSTSGFKLSASVDSPMHTTRFAVVDRSGVVQGTFDSDRKEELEELRNLVRRLLEKKS